MSAEIIPFRIERQDDGELRISDIELAERLGYTEVRSFRRVIRNNAEDLQSLGLLHRSGAKGSGRTQWVFWLNRAQAIHGVYRSETPGARRLAIELTKAFEELLSKTQRSLPIREWCQLNILSEQVSVWTREFPPDFFNHLHRVMGVTKPGRNNHSNCAHFINRYIYAFLFGSLGLEVIREANPTDDGYQRALRHHQVLKERHKPALRQHIDRVGVMLALSISLNHFDDQFNHKFKKPNTQIGFMFGETLKVSG
jgi:P63C domain